MCGRVYAGYVGERMIGVLDVIVCVDFKLLGDPCFLTFIETEGSIKPYGCNDCHDIADINLPVNGLCDAHVNVQLVSPGNQMFPIYPKCKICI